MTSAFIVAARDGASQPSGESSRPKVAAFGLKKMFDLFYILCNGKYIVDACGHFSLQRAADRSQPPSNISYQIVMEIRGSIVPCLAQAWDTALIEKIPDATVKLLINILNLVATADNEPAANAKDKVSTNEASLLSETC